MRVLLAISGGIAAYKAAELVRLYRKHGDSVQVAMTRSACHFITPVTLAALSGEPVLTHLFGRYPAAIEHIAAAQAADVAVVAPATADMLARMAHGLADDYVTTLLLATPAPVLAAPAMNVQMWRHAATQANVATLRTRGVTIVAPGEGELACGMVGEGRMAEPEAIFTASFQLTRRDLSGEHVLITAGPTREAIDPVRYLSNRSSGRMGYALAEAAAARGARVTLISGPTALAAPGAVRLIPVVTAEEMAAAAETVFADCAMAVLAAAVADYRPAEPQTEKIKKTADVTQLALVRTPDILATLGTHKRGQFLAGFAAETDSAHAVELARAKRSAKHADLMVLNDVSRQGIGFDSDQNAVTLITADAERTLPQASKRAIADSIFDTILELSRHAVTQR